MSQTSQFSESEVVNKIQEFGTMLTMIRTVQKDLYETMRQYQNLTDITDPNDRRKTIPRTNSHTGKPFTDAEKIQIKNVLDAKLEKLKAQVEKLQELD